MTYMNTCSKKLDSRLRGNDVLSPKILFWMVVLFLMTLKSHPSYVGQGDEPHYIVATESLLLDQDLDVANNYLSPRLRDFKPPHDHHAFLKPDGREIPAHPIGLPLLGVPVMAVSYTLFSILPASWRGTTADDSWIFTKNSFCFSMTFLAGGMAVLFFRFFQTLFGDDKKAWVLALAVALAPPFLSYGLLYFTEFPAAFMILLLLYRLFKRKPFGWLDAALAGYLPWLHARYYFIAGALVFFHWIEIYRDGGRGQSVPVRLWMLTAAVAVMWAGVIAMNIRMWGGVSPSLSYGAVKTFDPKYLPFALPGLFFDRSFGLFVYSPLYLFFPAGLVLLGRKEPRLVVYILILTVLGCVTVAGFHQWWGGWSPGPRYLTPVAPLLALGAAAFLFETWKRPGWRWLAYSLLGLTFILALFYWQRPKYLWNHEDGINKFFIYWFGSWGRRFEDLLPNFFLSFPVPQIQAAFYAVLVFVFNLFGYVNLRTRTTVK